MSSTWKIISISIAAAVLLGLGYWSYTHYRSIKAPHAAAIDAIDSDVVIFLQSNDIRNTVHTLFSETGYWGQLADNQLFASFQEQLYYLDSLVSTNGNVSEIFELYRFTVALSEGSEGLYGLVYLAELPPGDHAQTIERFIQETNGRQSIVLVRDFQSAQIATVNLTGPEALFYYSVYKGLFIGSMDESLVEQAVIQLSGKQALMTDRHFERLHATAGKNVDANVFVHLPHFIRWVGSNCQDLDQEFLNKLQGLGYWSELDMLINENDLLLNGYTITTDSAGKILNQFRHSPQAVKVPEVLPYNIQWMIHYGIGDARYFIGQTSNQNLLQARFKGYDQRYGIDLDADFLSWAGHELALASLHPGKGKAGSLVVLHSEDVVKALLSLGNMERKVHAREKSNSYVLNHRDHSIRRLGLPLLFHDIFGQAFPNLGNCYYTALQDYLLFSENALDLVEVIDQYYGGRSLSQSDAYQAFADNISDRSNIYIYANLDGAGQALDQHLNGCGRFPWDAVTDKFEAVALQFSYFNKMFYTNMFLSYNPDYQEVQTSNWNVALEADVAGAPHMIKNHRNNKMNVVVFDMQNTMYLVDHVGKIQWQLPLIERPGNQVYLIDYYNNGKFQYLFNTEHYVYLVDLNGNYVADFPRKMEMGSSNSIAAFDYDQTGDYRFVVALNDNRVHNFTKDLKPVPGWNRVQTSGRVEEPVQHIVKGGKDYFFISDAEGRLRITDRRGIDRIKPATKVDKAPASIYYTNRTNNKGLFLTTDRKGKVVYINENGKLKSTKFGSFSDRHYFFYEDFDQDDHLDFIYVDENRFVVFNRFKKVIAEQQFEEKIVHKPVLFNYAGKRLIGVVYDVAGEIRIFDHEGRRFQDHYIEGNGPFVIGSFENGKLNLITGKGQNLMNYQLN